MGGMEATEVCLRCEMAALLLGHSRGHGEEWKRERHIGHMLRSGQGGLRGSESGYRGIGSMRGQREGGMVG